MTNVFLIDGIPTPIGRDDGRKALCTMCIGVSQRIALVIESLR